MLCSLWHLNLRDEVAMDGRWIIIASTDARYAGRHCACPIKFIDPVVAFAPYVIHCNVVVETQRATSYQVLHVNERRKLYELTIELNREEEKSNRSVCVDIEFFSRKDFTNYPDGFPYIIFFMHISVLLNV